MATQVEMPKMGYDMTEGTILAWHKQEGDPVSKGDVLGEIETGKVNIEIEAFDAGILRKILVHAGQTVPVGTPIAIIGTADEPIDPPAAGTPDSSTAPAPPAPSTTPAPLPLSAASTRSTSPTTSTPSPNGTDAATVPPPVPATPTAAAETAPVADARLRASPLARRLAREHNIALGAVSGSGPNGRITRDDVLAAIGAGLAAPAVAVPAPAIPAPGTPAPLPAGGVAPAPVGDELREVLSPMRRTIARRLGESWTSAPHIFLTMPIRMDAALDLRKQINAALEAGGGGKISVNDLLIKAAARALRAHPRVNVSWDDGARIVHPRVHVGVAVALDDGLITLTVPDADLRPLSAIAAEVADKAARARAGKLQPDDLATPSTFTLSNLGMYGIEDFTAIINPPEAAILAVGAATPTPVVEDGAVAIRTVMKVTLSADHRVVDGAAAAEYLVTLKEMLERPLAMLV